MNTGEANGLNRDAVERWPERLLAPGFAFVTALLSAGYVAAAWKLRAEYHDRADGVELGQTA
jgi:hypothetical protein